MTLVERWRINAIFEKVRQLLLEGKTIRAGDWAKGKTVEGFTASKSQKFVWYQCQGNEFL